MRCGCKDKAGHNRKLLVAARRNDLGTKTCFGYTRKDKFEKIRPEIIARNTTWCKSRYVSNVGYHRTYYRGAVECSSEMLDHQKCVVAARRSWDTTPQRTWLQSQAI